MSHHKMSPNLDLLTKVFVHTICRPKAELHLHLEGSIRAERIGEFADAQGFLASQSLSRLNPHTSFANFAEFGDLYGDIIRTFSGPESFTTLVCDLGERLNADNVCYAEVTWTPQLHVSEAHPFEDWLSAANLGRRQVEEEYGIQLRWILDICRERHLHAPQMASSLSVAKWAASAATPEKGVVGLGLGGDEAGHPPHWFSEAFDLARQAGLGLVPHAGEHRGDNTGPAAIREALQSLCPTRIGHGNRAVEDKDLVAELRQRQVALELCPTSNIRFGTYQDLSCHPLKELLHAGCMVTVNTDDPGIFFTSLTDELVNAALALNLSEDDVTTLIDNAFKAAFDKSAAEKARLHFSARAQASSEVPRLPHAA
jgi:aminodeoxyfutalosine deaminase